ncbi:MAG TPA: SDR family NAD(P)-dependent oxidoreductase, partial [Candidatus Binatia bacterium]
MLKDKVVIVTGAAKGIGRYIAHGFAREGAKIAIGDIDLERMKQTEAELREIGADPLALKLDVRDEADVRGFMKRTADRFGAIDV